MKKVIAMLVCVLLVCTLSVTAFAAEKSPTGEEIQGGGGSSESPKTSDASAVYLSVGMLTALAVAAAAKKKLAE